MTKHWPEPTISAPAALSHYGEHHDHHLDFHRDAQHSCPPHSGVARSSAAQHWPHHLAHMVPQQRLEKPTARPEHITSTTAFMDTPAPPGSDYPNQQDANFKRETISQETWNGTRRRGSTSGAKRRTISGIQKPPYSYLAMIAMVIQRSPERKLTLSEILKEISTLFPFFKGNYKGWRDSVLKGPRKPQGKGNFWAVELSRVPLELLKRQNTAEDLFRPKLDSSFAIDSLLHSLRPPSASDVDVSSRDCWGRGERPRSPRPRYASSARSASASSASPASTSSSDEDWKGLSGKHVSFGRRGRVRRGTPTGLYSPVEGFSAQTAPLLMDLDHMLQSVPPNKSVFDVLVPTNQNSHHQPPSQYTCKSGPHLNRYPQY
ncbi:hypothetical protein KUCAC02_029551 [Chaenocephalus aceratus]|nr:hypothetical protein KUCAC02_029551 [Chaenocephalus aceratus]